MFRYASLGNATRFYPIGSSGHYFPLQISNGGTTDNVGARVQDDVLSGGLSGSSVNGAVNATWVLDEGTAGGSDLSISTSWNGSDEKPSFNRAASYLQGFSGSWTNLAGPVAATGTNPYSALFSGITANLNQLPVRISNYSPVANCQFQVVCFQQGLTHNGSHVPTDRSNPANAEVAQKSDVSGTVNFYSLGFNGSITLKSSCAVNNGPGNDIKIWETTYGAQPVNNFSDRARVYASQDGILFTYLGLATYDGAFDLGISLPWAQYFRIVDATVDSPSSAPMADAYDVDGIEVLNGYTTGGSPNQVTSGGAASICGGTQGKAKNFTNIVGLRSDPSKALGLPQNDDSFNFYALGFGGDVCVKFDFAIFDGPGGELKVVETTFGNNSCNQYRERAEIAVSFDGVNWNVLGEYCQDYNGTIDITAANSGIQYVRVRDVSNRADFSSALADGYDLDAVVATSALTAPCPTVGNNTRVAVSEPVLFDQTTVPDDMEPLQILGNPVAEELNIRFTMAVQEATVSVFNHTGQKVLSEMVRGNVWDLKEMKLDASDLPAGVYFLSLNGGIQKETISFVKK
ncbi:MAG TPA: T9SS type A sorting domain-containing protein, partial [Catalimonadaceae bacterium]|nr:T9SS type A sorting domain-containing protein [Catalimonadaceae bacterium]